MNLGGLVAWGIKTLALLDDPSRLAGLGISAELMRAKPGWLADIARRWRNGRRTWP
jgi:hypothetical protein